MLTGCSDTCWTPAVLFRVACRRRGVVPRQTCKFPWVFLWVVELCIVWHCFSMFLMCVASRRVWRMCLPVCLRCTVVDSSMTLFIGSLFLRIPTITCLHTGQMYLTRECPKPSKTILPNLPFAHPFLKTSWKPIHMAQRMAQADTSGAFGLEWVGPYALRIGSIIDLSAFPLSGVVLFMHSQDFATGSA